MAKIELLNPRPNIQFLSKNAELLSGGEWVDRPPGTVLVCVGLKSKKLDEYVTICQKETTFRTFMLSSNYEKYIQIY